MGRIMGFAAFFELTPGESGSDVKECYGEGGAERSILLAMTGRGRAGPGRLRTMRQHSQISVLIPEDFLDLFLARVSEYAARRWRRDFEVEAKGLDLASSLGVRYIYFVRMTGKPAEVVFIYSNEHLKLINVFTDGHGIGYTEHERISAEFWKAGMKRVCDELQLSGQFLPSKTVRPEEGLPPDVVAALYRFSICVNKSDGGTAHPSDMALWCQFLSVSHMRAARMDEVRLSEYLLEKKFPEDAVEALVLQYEMAMSLLPLYDRLAERATPVLVQ